MDSPIETIHPPQPARPPLTVWVISLTQLWWTIYSLFWAYMLASGKVELGPQERAYFLTFTWFDYLMIAAVAVGHVTSAIYLFFLKPRAVLAYHVLLGLNIFQNAWTIYSKPIEGATMTGFVSGTLVIFVMGLYARRLRRLGIINV